MRCAAHQTRVRAEVATARYAAEMAWTLRGRDDGDDGGGGVLLGGPGEGLPYADYASYTAVACLPDGRFSLACADTAADGPFSPGRRSRFSPGLGLGLGLRVRVRARVTPGHPARRRRESDASSPACGP